MQSLSHVASGKNLSDRAECHTLREHVQSTAKVFTIPQISKAHKILDRYPLEPSAKVKLFLNRSLSTIDKQCWLGIHTKSLM